MNGMIADLTLEYLNKTKTGAAILKILPVFQQAQETLLSYLEDTSPDHQKQIRMGTVLTLLILGKLASGKRIKDFQAEDWQDVASRAAEYAIKIDPQQYSISIFSLMLNMWMFQRIISECFMFQKENAMRSGTLPILSVKQASS